MKNRSRNRMTIILKQEKEQQKVPGLSQLPNNCVLSVGIRMKAMQSQILLENISN